MQKEDSKYFSERAVTNMIEVRVSDAHSFEKAMRMFKKACQKDGFMMEIKERRFYTKPSEKKRHRNKKR